MRLPSYAVKALLILLYIAAVITRFASAERSTYLYFNGASATNYRYAHGIGQRGSVPDLDQKLSWPEGVPVAQVRPLGMEYFAGYLYKLVKYFSETEERDFIKHLTRLFFSLMVFTIYGLTYTLWQCQAGALFASFLVAFYSPLVEPSDGGLFLHLQYAVVLLSIHILLVLRLRNRFSMAGAALASLSSFAILAVWEIAAYYLAVFVFLYAVWPGGDLKKKRYLLVMHSAVFIAAGSLLPHMSAQRLVFTLPASCVYSAALYALLAGKLPLRYRGAGARILFIILGTAVLSVLLRPLSTGSFEPYPVVQYFLYRLMYFSAKPQNPLALPDEVRFMWTVDHAPPPMHQIFYAFFPIVFLIPPLVAAVITFRRDSQKTTLSPPGDSPTEGKISLPLLPTAVISLISGISYLFDRSILPLAVLGIFPLLAVPLHGFSRHMRIRGPFIALGTLLILFQTFSHGGRLDVPQKIARRVGFNPDRSSDFIRVSIGDADLNLVRFLVSRTSVRDPMLSLPEISSLLATFAGRTTILAPGVESRAMIDKTVSFLGEYYKSEKELYRTCRANGIQYVLYSIECVLDGSNYSPRYIAGKNRLEPSSVAYKMHFFPEMLKNFSLVYENDYYRLYEVTGEPKPIFSTDHPLVYQYEILEHNHDSLELFYNRISRLIFLYGTAREEQAKGNDEKALELFNACIYEAPRFTAALLGQAASYSNLGNLEAAKESYLAVVSYAPDNQEALYGTAFILARTGDTEAAQGYVDVLLSSTGDAKMIQKAKLLKWFLDEGIPIDEEGGLEQPETGEDADN